MDNYFMWGYCNYCISDVLSFVALDKCIDLTHKPKEVYQIVIMFGNEPLQRHALIPN